MADDATLSLYDRDFYLWTQTEAEKLRARIGRDNELDYENLAEEVEAMGRSERAAVSSAVRNIIRHLYKLSSSLRDEPKGHWRVEILNFRQDVENHITPSIRRMVTADLEDVHRKAGTIAQADFDVHEPGARIDPTLRWSWAEIMGEENDPLDRVFPVND